VGISGVHFQQQERPKLDHFFLLRRHEPYEKLYNDVLGYGFLAYTGLFSIIPVVLKVNTTQESYPIKKELFLNGFPWPGLTLKITKSQILH